MFAICKLDVTNVLRGGSRVWKGGCTLLKKVEDQKKKRERGRSRVDEGNSNITMKLKYIIIIPIYSFTDKQHYTATALFIELLTDCSIRVSRSFMTKVWGGGGHVPPTGSAPGLLYVYEYHALS